MKLNVYYDGETDTLSLWNGKPASEGADVAENLTADFDAEGEVVGFTLEHASEMLKAIVGRSFPAWWHEGLTPKGNEHAPETLKATDGHWFFAWDHGGLTQEGSEHALETLKAAGVHPFPAWIPKGLMPEGGKHALEMQKGNVVGPIMIWNPGGLTPEDIEKLGIRDIASSPENLQYQKALGNAVELAEATDTTV